MLDPIVLDASAWLAVLLREEQAEVLEGLLENHALLAPELIRYETANGLLFAQRRRRRLFKKSTLSELLKVVLDYPIRIIPLKVWWKESVALAERHDLTFYDAAYLGTAQALRIPLLTFDRQILEVMNREGVRPVELP